MENTPQSELIQEAFLELYPEKEFDLASYIEYKGRMKRYNANVLYSKIDKKIVFRLGKGWISISSQIKKGMLQELMVRLFKKKHEQVKSTVSMELYSIFVKKMHMSIPKIKTDPVLDASFERVNNSYFNGMMEKPNLEFKGKSFRKLAKYDYNEDKVTVSKIFSGCDNDVLDYLMYHELLHKKMQFNYKNGKNYHHTTVFKNMEKIFLNAEGMEDKIKSYLMAKRREARKKKVPFSFGGLLGFIKEQ